MEARCHRFAGSSLNRLAAGSDGVFAVAMTVLVLNLKAPTLPKRIYRLIWSAGGGGSESASVHDLLHHVAPHLLPYAMSMNPSCVPLRGDAAAVFDWLPRG
jgi:uncharacterized membrane protein